MPNELIYALAGLLSYFVGAIPAGYIVCKLKTGKDIRTMGSGNIGATNVARVLGTPWFVPVFIFDFFKGFAPVFWLAPWVATRWRCPTCPALLTCLAVRSGLDEGPDHARRVVLTTAATIAGPMTGAIARGGQSCCTEWSLSLLPWAAALLLAAVLAQLAPIPDRAWPRLARHAAWALGWLGWFASGIVSLLHALS